MAPTPLIHLRSRPGFGGSSENLKILPLFGTAWFAINKAEAQENGAKATGPSDSKAPRVRSKHPREHLHEA